MTQAHHKHVSPIHQSLYILSSVTYALNSTGLYLAPLQLHVLNGFVDAKCTDLMAALVGSYPRPGHLTALPPLRQSHLLLQLHLPLDHLFEPDVPHNLDN